MTFIGAHGLKFFIRLSNKPDLKNEKFNSSEVKNGRQNKNENYFENKFSMVSHANENPIGGPF